MDEKTASGVCQFYLIVVAAVFGAVTWIAYDADGPGVVVIVLAALCLLCLWGAAFGSARIQEFLASVFASF
jgi:hypothetical protein